MAVRNCVHRHKPNIVSVSLIFFTWIAQANKKVHRLPCRSRKMNLLPRHLRIVSRRQYRSIPKWRGRSGRAQSAQRFYSSLPCLVVSTSTETSSASPSSALSSDLSAEGAAMVAMVKSRSVIVGVTPSGKLTAEM